MNFMFKATFFVSRCLSMVTVGQSMFGTSNFGTNLRTSAPNIKFGTEFHWNLNFGIMQKDYVCRS